MPTIHLNGQEREVTSHPDMPLLWVIREEFNLTGSKYSCGHGVCGGCVCEVDGAQVHLCKNTVADVQGKKVITIEGQEGPVAEAVFNAWLALDVAQCGMCQPAQINSAVILLKQNVNPTDDDIDEAMKHNLCRCATYQRIRKAIHLAATSLRSN
ncbi:(2Fe-2S)-binding protein [Spirosoma jeollabukense]